jgi:uncharacterized membrane protein YbhN (UPF0104 family)
MPFVILKFLHVGSMFLATALAVGPSVLLYRIGRRGEETAIHATFPQASAVFRVSRALYGLGILFGFAAALTGELDLTSGWLLAAYGLVGLLIVVLLAFERWTTRVEKAADRPAAGSERLADVTRSAGARYLVASMILITVAIVYVMVTKPNVA